MLSYLRGVIETFRIWNLGFDWHDARSRVMRWQQTATLLRSDLHRLNRRQR